MEWRESDGVRWLEAELGGATAAFSTRQGGGSKAPFDSLNLGLLTEDEPKTVIENRRRLAAALRHNRIAHARQVHGKQLLDADASGIVEFVGVWPTNSTIPAELPEADGQIVREPGVAGLVFVADCLPVVLHGPGGMAVLHCGWRGLAAGIVADGAAAVGATAAAVGPGIGPCCYEVGEEVLDAFSGLGDGIASGRMLDLPEVARRLLAAAGVETVESADLCTSCNPEVFFSHRRDAGRTGRQAGLGWLTGKAG
ncbi:MAG TPA: polyphenol oxidase family protein [Solirubrobacterales bacterium]|nr:polyphenol oxidase family protein [Solirubrobacterales bacterium]